MEQVAPGIWRAGTRYVNWYVVDGGADGLTVIDAGFPKYADHLDASLAKMGRARKDVRAVVLTHGHIDHIGMAATFAASGATVHLHPADVTLAAQPKTNTPEKTLPYMLFPATVAFIAHAMRNGATMKPHAMPASVPLVDGSTADVPGRPLVRHVPGHTDGSCVLEFQDHGVTFVGDLLCTIEPKLGRRDDPQLQSRGSNKSSDQAMESLAKLEGIASRVVLPGHGTPWTDGIESALQTARRIGCR
jgi:glyoxylase-like metal-dependent hydrolase (beta-lactamase superfamily II)